MAAPVLDSVTPAGPVTATVGSQVVLTAVAHDDDTRTETFTLVVKDSAGHPSVPATVKIKWVDGLTLEVTSDGASPVSISGMVATIG